MVFVEPARALLKAPESKSKGEMFCGGYTVYAFVLSGVIILFSFPFGFVYLFDILFQYL